MLDLSERIYPKKMKLFFGLIVAINLSLAGCAFTNGATEFSLTFSAKDVQEAIDRAPKSKSLIDGLVVVSIDGSPFVRLGNPIGRIGFDTRLSVQVYGAPAIMANVRGSAKLVYLDAQRSFFLDDPIFEVIESPYLPKYFEPIVLALAKEQVTKIANTTPVFVLPEDGTFSYKTAQRMLKSIQIQPGQVIATFSMR